MSNHMLFRGRAEPFPLAALAPASTPVTSHAEKLPKICHFVWRPKSFKFTPQTIYGMVTVENWGHYSTGTNKFEWKVMGNLQYRSIENDNGASNNEGTSQPNKGYTSRRWSTDATPADGDAVNLLRVDTRSGSIPYYGVELSEGNQSSDLGMWVHETGESDPDVFTMRKDQQVTLGVTDTVAVSTFIRTGAGFDLIEPLVFAYGAGFYQGHVVKAGQGFDSGGDHYQMSTEFEYGYRMTASNYAGDQIEMVMSWGTPRGSYSLKYLYPDTEDVMDGSYTQRVTQSDHPDVTARVGGSNPEVLATYAYFSYGLNTIRVDYATGMTAGAMQAAIQGVLPSGVSISVYNKVLAGTSGTFEVRFDYTITGGEDMLRGLGTTTDGAYATVANNYPTQGSGIMILSVVILQYSYREELSGASPGTLVIEGITFNTAFTQYYAVRGVYGNNLPTVTWRDNNYGVCDIAVTGYWSYGGKYDETTGAVI